MSLQDRKKRQSNRNLIITILVGFLSIAFFVMLSPKPPEEDKNSSKLSTASLSPTSVTTTAGQSDSAPDKQQINIWRSQQNLPKELPDDMVRALNTAPPQLPPEMQKQLSAPPPQLPEDLKKQLEGPPPPLPPDLAAQLNAPPPEIPEDIKRALATPPRVVTLEEVNTPPR